MVDALPEPSAFWRGIIVARHLKVQVAQQQDAAMNELWKRLGLPPTRSVL